MVSCTEFIPLYSELFGYIEEKAGHAAVVKYWERIRDVYTEPLLGKLAKEKGIGACWAYWSYTLNEEAADFIMTYDEEAGVYELDMRDCPSKGMLDSLEHMRPYDDYCGHCAVLYAPVLNEHGVRCEENFVKYGPAKCRAKFSKKEDNE